MTAASAIVSTTFEGDAGGVVAISPRVPELGVRSGRDGAAGLLTPSQLAVLTLLVVGVGRRVIAKQMHLGRRTIDARISEVRRVLSASSRMCLGARAISYHLIDGELPISYAMARRPDECWVVPTVRQRMIVGRLAGGATAVAVSREIGIALRTVRHDLSRLAVANGAADLTHAGGLYQALGWTAAGSR